MGTTVLPSVKASTETSGPVEKFLNDHLVAALAEDVILHHVPDGGFGLVPGLGDDNTLAQAPDRRP